MDNIRLKKVYEKLAESGLKQMVVTDPASVFYLTGKWLETGERLLALYINSSSEPKLLVNELYAFNDELGVQMIWYNDTEDSTKILAGLIEKDKPVGIDKNMAARFLLGLMALNAASGYINSSISIDLVRACKDEHETELMRNASLLNDKAMDIVRGYLKAGISEVEISDIVIDTFKQLGADGISFLPIIGFGANAADAHHVPDTTTLNMGDCILLDMGCKKDGYCSDMTRTYFFGMIPGKMKRVYEVVKQASEAARAMIRPGVLLSQIDLAARSIIEEAGYGKYFTHRLGHFLGIEVHEYGDVSSISSLQAAPGMVFSIEPGIYIPGEGGVRIEDLVLVTENGSETLNFISREPVIV